LNSANDTELTKGWVQLLQEIKSIYSGKITSLIASEGLLYPWPIAIPREIIDELDVLGIGLGAGFTNKNDPTVEELIATWYNNDAGVSLIDYLRAVHEIYGKNILITDEAFHSFDGANIEEAVIFNESIPLVLDEQEQADLFEAFFYVLSSQNWDWLEGVMFSSLHRLPAETEPLVSRHLGKLGERIMGKQAEAIVKDWFDAPTN
jgi:hypothetical protein